MLAAGAVLKSRMLRITQGLGREIPQSAKTTKTYEIEPARCGCLNAAAGRCQFSSAIDNFIEVVYRNKRLTILTSTGWRLVRCSADSSEGIEQHD